VEHPKINTLEDNTHQNTRPYINQKATTVKKKKITNTTHRKRVSSMKTSDDHLQEYEVYDVHHDHYAQIRVVGEAVCFVAALCT